MSDVAFEFGPEIEKLSAALVEFQGTVGAVAKTKTAKVQMKSGGTYSYNFADLADVIASTKEARVAAGLGVVQMPINGLDGGVTIVTTVLHTSGQWMRSSLTMYSNDSSPQGIGSLISYGRRYCYSAALGICTEDDDDGNAAQGHDAKTGAKGRAEGKAPAAPADRGTAPKSAASAAPAGTSATPKPNPPPHHYEVDPVVMAKVTRLLNELGWAKPHAVNWLKKHFQADSMAKLTSDQVVAVAEKLEMEAEVMHAEQERLAAEAEKGAK